jgi:hypothetical protein
MSETNATKSGIWLKVVRLIVFAATLLVALPAVDMGDPVAMFVFGVIVPLPLYITLWLLRSEARPVSLRSGLSLSRALGIAGALMLIGELYYDLFVGWPTHPELIALLSVFLVAQIVLVIGASILIRRPNAAGAAPARADRALAGLAYTLLVLLVIAFFANPFRHGTGLSSRESSAISRLQSFSSAEEAFVGANGGFYGPVECLATPSQCLPNYAPTSPIFLTQDLVASTHRGYVFTFHPGTRPSAEEIQTAGASARSLKSWAYSAIPVVPGRSGFRSFCVDQAAVLRHTTDGTTPTIVDGRCPETMVPFR